jgi:hypothetical protein
MPKSVIGNMQKAAALAKPAKNMPTERHHLFLHKAIINIGN